MTQMIKYKGTLYQRVDSDSKTLIKLIDNAKKALDEASKSAMAHIEVRDKELRGLENRLNSGTIDIDGATIKYVHSIVGKVESLAKSLRHLP